MAVWVLLACEVNFAAADLFRRSLLLPETLEGG